MKKTNMLLGALLLILASCEMKDELLGKSSSTETGALELALSVPDRTPTRAVDTDDFTVTITDTENAENTYKYVYSEMENPIRLSVGNYRVTAHSAGDIAPIMSEAYYGGSTSTDLVITPGVTAQTTVECKMMNTQLSLSYGEDFLAAFKSWTITLDDGNAHTHTINGESGTATEASWYWYIAESQPSELTLNVIAITTDDQTIRETKKLRKADAEESYGDDTDYFAGGDNLNITLGAIDEDETEPENGSIGIVIEADITFAGTDDTVEIPVEDVPDEEEPEQPEQPGGDEPQPEGSDIVISEPNNTNYLEEGVIVNNGKYPDNLLIQMDVKNGIKNLFVKIESTNNTFLGLVGKMGLTEGEGMDLASGSEDLKDLSTLFPLPAANSNTYQFSMSEQLFGLLGGFKGTHTFILTVVDKNDQEKSAALVITIN